MTELSGTNDALLRADHTSSRSAGFALNRVKQTKNLIKDTNVQDYDMVRNNHDENVNVKCSSGFYLEVAHPALLHLAKLSLDQVIIINNVKILCTNTRVSLDDNNLLVNSTYFFNLLENITDYLLGTVTIHCHVTTKLVQLQGSRLISGYKAPVWFFDNVLSNTFMQEAIKKKTRIELAHKKINNLSTDSSSNDCTLCDKKYKSISGLQKHLNTKHDGHSLQLGSDQQSRKRKSTSLCLENEELLPPAKSAAIGLATPITFARPPLSTTEGPVLVLSFDVATAEDGLCPPLPPPESSTSRELESIDSPVTAVAASVQSSVANSVVASVQSPATNLVLSSLNCDAAPFLPTSILPITTSSSGSGFLPTFRWTGPPLVTSAASSSRPVSSLTPPLSIAVPTPAVTTKTRVKQKPSTLALNPNDFEKENLKVQRDALRLKLSEQDVQIKDLNEKLDIFVTRCNLFERERSEQAYKSATASLPASPKSGSDSSSTASSVSHPSNPSSTTTPLPATQSAIESLINLEVLRFVSGNKTTPPMSPLPPQTILLPPVPPNPEKDILSMFTNLEIKLSEKIETLKLEMIQNVESLLNSYLLSRDHDSGGVSASAKSPTISPEVPARASPPPAPGIPAHSSPPPPPSPSPPPCDISGGTKAMNRTPSFGTEAPPCPPGGAEARSSGLGNEVPSSTSPTPAVSSIPYPPRRKCLLGSPPMTPSTSSSSAPAAVLPSASRRKSLLGPPPLRTRIPGKITPPSSAFYLKFGQPSSLKKKNMSNLKSKIKKPHYVKKVKQHSRKPVKEQHFTDNLVVLSPDSPPHPPPPAQPQQSPAVPPPSDESLINLDDEAVTDDFGDPVNEVVTVNSEDLLSCLLDDEAESCIPPMQPSLN